MISINTTPAIEELQKVVLSGNVIPHIWYQTITYTNKRGTYPHLLGINILADILYWYRPVIVRDEATGHVIGVNKKFASDKLQKKISDIANQFGVSYKLAKAGIDFLESEGLITKELREVTLSDGTKLYNVLFLEPVISEVKNRTDPTLTLPPNWDRPSPRIGIDPPPELGGTNTESTTESTTESYYPYKAENKKTKKATNPELETSSLNGNTFPSHGQMNDPGETEKEKFRDSLETKLSEDPEGPCFPLPYTLSEVARDLRSYYSSEEKIQNAIKLAGRADITPEIVAQKVEDLIDWFGKNNKRLRSWSELNEWFIKIWIREHKIIIRPTEFKDEDLDGVGKNNTVPAEIFAIRNFCRHMVDYLCSQPQLNKLDGIYGKTWHKIVPLVHNSKKREWFKSAVMKVAKEKKYAYTYFTLFDAISAAYNEVLSENNIQKRQ